MIFTGELNVSHQSAWYQTLALSSIIKDTYKEVKHPYANNASFNAFGAALSRNEVIDRVFVNNNFSVEKWSILTDSYHGQFPSDHFPVLVKLRYK